MINGVAPPGGLILERRENHVQHPRKKLGSFQPKSSTAKPQRN